MYHYPRFATIEPKLYCISVERGAKAMITISLCMIVKNEEKVLARCLDSLQGLADEIIIVDTGSTDRTKEIAARYTDKVYDFAWIDDFSAARNFAFSLASCEYIYSADADEVLSEENRERFLQLKQTLLPEIEIVQMKYGNQLQYGGVYNFDEEYRPKLFKRLREFEWIEAIHETVRLEPVVYDSDIVITHMPHQSNAKRDLANFNKQITEGKRLSVRLQEMYARELLIAGDEEDLRCAESYFQASCADPDRKQEEIIQACCVATKAARLRGDTVAFMKYSSKVLAQDGCSEVCCELGHFYEGQCDYEEAIIWYYNAAYEVAPVLNIGSGQREPLEGLIRCYEQLGMPEQAAEYRREVASLSEHS